LVQDIIHLARGIRNKHNIKNRQPLSVLQVALVDKNHYAIVEEYKNIISEELNVKTIELINDVEDIAHIDYKVNFATVGKTMGSKIPVITRAIKSGNIKLVDGKYIVSGEEEITLDKEDILVTYVAKSDKPVLSDDKIVVALDLTITDELKEEGIAREIVRNIQDARKQLDLQIMDKITIELVGDYPANYVDYICKETLATMGEVASSSDIMIETDGVKIYIKK
jgi:isoleucyl-tRNA synthetase